MFNETLWKPKDHYSVQNLAPPDCILCQQDAVYALTSRLLSFRLNMDLLTSSLAHLNSSRSWHLVLGPTQFYNTSKTLVPVSTFAT
jgi:hypothetical protein